MIAVLYHILSTVAAVLVLPVFFFYSIITGKKARGMGHHFGYVPALARRPGHPVLWLQALSFGEVNATGGAAAGAGGVLINAVSVEAIQEFKATGSAFSAE